MMRSEEMVVIELCRRPLSNDEDDAVEAPPVLPIDIGNP